MSVKDQVYLKPIIIAKDVISNMHITLFLCQSIFCGVAVSMESHYVSQKQLINLSWDCLMIDKRPDSCLQFHANS